MENPHLQRALLLMDQSRFEMAEGELRGALATDANHPMLHSLLALCLSHRKQYDEATAEAQMGIHLAPDIAFTHFALSQVWYDRNRYDEASAALNEAIALDPYSVRQFARLAAIKYDQRDWTAALEAAERGLEIDAEDVGCTNIRALALNKLGRSAGAVEALQSALAKAPENADTHASLGWTRLQQNQPREALEHFREALRLNPESEWARAGIVEALKARNVIYRWLLAYFIWMARLSDRAQWGVIIGGYIAYRVLRGVARDNPELAVWIQPLLWLYIAFAVLTWIGPSLFNLLLRLNRFGRLALSHDQLVASNWIGGTLLTALCLFIPGLILGHVNLLITALMAGLLMLPLSATFNLHEGWPRKTMAFYTLGLFVLALSAALPMLLADELGATADQLVRGSLLLFFLGVFVSQFVANGLASRRPRH